MSFQNRSNHKLVTESFTNKGARQASEMLKKIPNANNSSSSNQQNVSRSNNQNRNS